MNLKDSIELEKYRHECVLTQLHFERETRIMLLQMQLGLNQKEPETQEERLLQELEKKKEEFEDLKSELDKSKEKYGGKKK